LSEDYFQAKLSYIFDMIKIFLLDTTLILVGEKPWHDAIESEITEVINIGEESVYPGKDPVTRLLEQIIVKHPGKTIYIWGREPDELLETFSDEMTNIVASGGLVQNPSEEILFIKRKGKWDLPKGKPDKGESLSHAAIREVEEECNISGLSILKPLPDTYHIYESSTGKFVLKRCCWFHMKAENWQNPKPQLEEEITQAEWIKRPVPDYIKNGAFLSIKDLVDQFERKYYLGI
jgi:8-oxo-dGTP pyrophosphatase MutT (NUDIX family)